MTVTLPAASAPMTSTKPAWLTNDNNNVLLEVKNLHTHFHLAQGTVKAVDGVDFTVLRGQTVGIVGESGCGKSVMARSILRIVPPPGRIVEGQLLFHHDPAHNNSEPTSQMKQVIDLATLDPKGSEIRGIRGGEISMIFQEPMTSLSPVHTIGNQIIEAIRLHQNVTKEQARAQAIGMLEKVNMPQPSRIIDRYPYQLSGGMRQRAMIAMALSCQPSLLIADEPTTALDVTTQAQILTQLSDLQREFGMAIIFITHDLGVIAQMVDYVVVMYLGKVVEIADVDSIFYDPKHPYTQSLLRSIPRLGRKSTGGGGNRLTAIRGTVPDPYSIPPGCPFNPRCRKALVGVCDKKEPPFVTVSNGATGQSKGNESNAGQTHKVRCILYE